MSEHEEKILQAVLKISEMVELLAGEEIAQRDAKQRVALHDIVGNSKPKQKSILLMDGTRTQADIYKETGMDRSNLSKMIKELEQAKLLVGDPKKPQLIISIPKTFFENGSNGE